MKIKTKRSKRKLGLPAAIILCSLFFLAGFYSSIFFPHVSASLCACVDFVFYLTTLIRGWLLFYHGFAGCACYYTEVKNAWSSWRGSWYDAAWGYWRSFRWIHSFSGNSSLKSFSARVASPLTLYWTTSDRIGFPANRKPWCLAWQHIQLFRLQDAVRPT